MYYLKAPRICGAFASTGTPVIPTSYFALIDKNFRFPMVWTTDLAVDKDLGNGFTATVEATYTKDIYALDIRNANLKPADSVFYEGDYTRPRYTSAAARPYYSNAGAAYTLENTNKGYSATFTAQLSKQFKTDFTAISPTFAPSPKA